MSWKALLLLLLSLLLLLWLLSTLTSDCAEHDSTPTHRVKAAKAAAARATRPSKVIYVPVHYQRHQSHCHSGAQAGGSQDPRHPLRGHGRARGHMDKRDGHGNGPAATYGMCLCLSVCLSVMILCMHSGLGNQVSHPPGLHLMCAHNICKIDDAQLSGVLLLLCQESNCFVE